MAYAPVTITTNAALLRTITDSEFGLDPFEESVVAGFVAKPIGTSKVGKELVLRKIAAHSASKYAGGGGLPANLNTNANTEVAVTLPIAYAYAMGELDEAAVTRLVDDGNFRAGYRKQQKAAVNAQIDVDLFTLAASLSHSESGAAVTETMYASALKQLAKYAKNKFKIGETDVRLYVHPDVLDDVLVMPLAKEYQIRGSAGTAVSGQLATSFGIKIEESGSVYQNAGHTYCPLILKDAWAIGYNIMPSDLPDQQDGLHTRLIHRAEYACGEWFDSSGVVLDIS